MATKRLNIYNDTTHSANELAEELIDYLKVSFETTKEEAREMFDDELAKYKVTITVEVDH